jgi:hypothetical protein
MDENRTKLELQRKWRRRPGDRIKTPSLLACDEFRAHVIDAVKELKTQLAAIL